MHLPIHRRTLLRAGALGAVGFGMSGLFPAWAQSGSPGVAGKGGGTLSGSEIRLDIAPAAFTVDGRQGHGVAMNGTIPAPLIRLREGQDVRLVVTNHLDEDTSIHWHGVLVPTAMDGVPGVSFPGIKPGSTFVYEFPIKHSGTYWYHSHSGLQEQLGHYGPLIFDPAEPDPVAYDREHVIILSDWTFLHPHTVFDRMKQDSGFFNRRKMTLLGGNNDMSQADRGMFAKMRMDPTDIADIGAAAYTYLVNGHGPEENWTGLFRPGERVRLRIINSATQTIFNLRIPGLPMTVIAADGVNVRPVETDEIQIGNAETYDLIVQPRDQAYTLVAESIDRSGMGRATLAPRMGMTAPVPPLRERPTLTMKDMGMGNHGGSAPVGASETAVDHGNMPGMGSDSSAAGMAAMGAMKQRDRSKVPPNVRVGVGVDNIAAMPMDRTGDPGIGLEDVGHRVLTYRDLVSLAPNKDARAPTRLIEIHLTGNMERFMWSMDGQQVSENPEPYRFALNERVRMRLVNDTMMIHPMHIHGHFWEVVNGNPGHQPLKHTVKVLPGGFIDLDLTADAPGDWAFHCHLLYHMHAGMMRIVKIRPMEGEGA